MTVKDLIVALLDMNMNKDVSIEYPADDGLIVGNYSRYKEVANFDVSEYSHGVIIGIDNDN